MPNHLKAITARAKKIYKAHPSMKWTSAIKQASAELRKKKPAKRRAVGSVKKKTRAKAIRRVKVLHKAEGRAIKAIGSIAFHKSQIRKQAEEKLAWGMLAKSQAKTKMAKRKIEKKLQGYRKDIRNL